MNSRTPTISRRDFVAAGLATAGSLAGRPLWGCGLPSDRPTVRQSVGLVIRNERPLDAEAPLDALEPPVTRLEHFFVRSHFGPPAEIPDRWTLTVDGDVATPVTLGLDEIRRLPSVSRPVTLECAGNGRGLFELPNTSGIQWERGAVSTAVWTGVPLATVLERAGVSHTAQHFWMEALDRAPLPAVPKFLRSIPRDLALSDALVAFQINGRPIPILYGGPLRLILPGWFGMASTKWLTHVHARPTVSDNHFMARGYRYGDGSPVESMQVKSLITAPLAEARVPVGRVRVRGKAWSGAKSGGIRGVGVSADGGVTWMPARLTGREEAHAWRSWEYELVVAAAGPHAVLARATDRSGAVQPMAAPPNPAGYGNNSVHAVRFYVV